MSEISSEKNILLLLKLLEQGSNENRILAMSTIITELKNQGATSGTDRRTIGKLMQALIDFGYDISTYAENGKGYYLRTRSFEDCEIDFLLKSVETSKSIPGEQRSLLIRKLARLKSGKYRTIFFGNPSLHEGIVQNNDLFLNMELVEEAIATHQKIQYTLCAYGTDKQLHADGTGKKYVANPFKLAVVNQKTYFIGSYGNEKDLTHVRLDRMRDVEILEKSTKIFFKDLRSYIHEHPYMCVGKVTTATLQIEKDIIGDVLDTFGRDVVFTDERERTVHVTLKATARSLRYWAMQYGTKCEVLLPADLRASVAKMANHIAEKYR